MDSFALENNMTKDNPKRHHRRSIRLKGYDYSQAGAYFVTICVQNRECRFGVVEEGGMQLNGVGKLIQQQWEVLPKRYPLVGLDASVIMPNHFHGIIVIQESVGASLVGASVKKEEAITRVDSLGSQIDGGRATTRVAPTLGEMVGAFKSITAVEYLQGVDEFGWPNIDGRLWQRNYYEHIVRNEKEMSLIRQYIADNPRQWEFDRENPRQITNPDRIVSAVDRLLYESYEITSEEIAIVERGG